jgi:copper homeostasis protein
VSVLVEACVESLEESLVAERAGANRLELCDNLAVGGTTPSPQLIDAVRGAVKIPVMVMIRPRGGSFVHTAQELDQMRRDLDMALAHDVDGVVLGILDDDNAVDVERVAEFVRLARGTPVTFHKAFDVISDRRAGLDALIDAGVTRLLTSGGAPTALEGARELAKLVVQAEGRIEIMAGGKVRGSNVGEIVRRAGLREVHARSERDEAQIRAIVEALSPTN